MSVSQLKVTTKSTTPRKFLVVRLISSTTTKGRSEFIFDSSKFCPNQRMPKEFDFLQNILSFLSKTPSMSSFTGKSIVWKAITLIQDNEATRKVVSSRSTKRNPRWLSHWTNSSVKQHHPVEWTRGLGASRPWSRAVLALSRSVPRRDAVETRTILYRRPCNFNKPYYELVATETASFCTRPINCRTESLG